MRKNVAIVVLALALGLSVVFNVGQAGGVATLSSENAQIRAEYAEVRAAYEISKLTVEVWKSIADSRGVTIPRPMPNGGGEI